MAHYEHRPQESFLPNHQLHECKATLSVWVTSLLCPCCNLDANSCYLGVRSQDNLLSTGGEVSQWHYQETREGMGLSMCLAKHKTLSSSPSIPTHPHKRAGRSVLGSSLLSQKSKGQRVIVQHTSRTTWNIQIKSQTFYRHS